MSDYKQTLNLPKTEFPMRAGLNTREPQILAQWKELGLYQRIQEARKEAPVFILHDGPPFANGDVHMGTALNKVLKDIVVRSKTMAGYRAPFRPGWDCHGLPIEFKVVKASKGLNPAEVRKKSEEYARKFINIQRDQFIRLGVSGDWEHPYLTLDPSYEAEVVRCFARFVKAGLVYRSRKPVLWSTGAQTALAEAEVEYQEKTSPAVYVKFTIPAEEATREGLPADLPLSIVIWTTTPWTLPANLAIAIDKDSEYEVLTIGNERLIVAHKLADVFRQAVGIESWGAGMLVPGSRLVGIETRHPFLERSSPIFAADFVTLDTGTGCVHIAPGHGDNDYLLGREHGLDPLSPVDDHGCYTAECALPSLVGKYVFDANKDIILLLQEKGALLGHSEYLHSYPHCWRSKTPIIFRAVEQFFIRIDDLRAAALEAIENVTWLPHWGKNRIRGTVESRPDWCISRQRAWGIPIPIFYTSEGVPILDSELIGRTADIFAREGTHSWFEKSDADWATLLGLPEGTTRRNDTLDVWIDSGVSHEAVLRHNPDFSFPADLYLEATDQHRGWFQSSLITSVALNQAAPYRSVLTHGFVVDVDTRRKISKSEQGGYQKPTDAQYFINKFGADLVRLWVSSVNFADDVPFSEEIFTRLTDTYRRIRNTLRILLANLSDFDIAVYQKNPAPLTLVDRWLISKMKQVVTACLEAYSRLEFHRVYQILNQFCAVDLSSLYVDITKDRLYCDPPNSSRRCAAQWVMHTTFDVLCRTLAPILVFTAEEAWGHFKPGESVHLQCFKKMEDNAADEATTLRDFSELLEIRSQVTAAMESAQKAGLIGSPLEAEVVFRTTNERIVKYFQASPGEVEEILILSNLNIIFDSVDAISVVRTSYKKCARCWRHREEVGKISSHRDLCRRCNDAILQREKKKL
ncbi:MAG: isoleucine--tRNA ligase [Verrucomicrobia bacterium]|nr:MAG: isoleucine--tRNA ligase [Verrucomicrobiota bacterium]